MCVVGTGTRSAITSNSCAEKSDLTRSSQGLLHVICFLFARCLAEEEERLFLPEIYPAILR
jgi:hypothetical protein